MKAEKIILSRWFLILMFLSALILPPFASKGFAPSEIGDIIAATLSNSFVKYFVPYAYIFQIVALIFFIGIILLEDKFKKPFTIFAGCSFFVYMLVQNMAVTDEFGLSFVISNMILMLLTSLVWLGDAWRKKTKYTFQNVTTKNGWLIAVAIFCFWWPMNFAGKPDFNVFHFFTGHVAQSIQFCPMTPIFLIIFILCKPTISLVVYRMTAISGTIIGFWNMMNFFNPSTLYVGLYHLPLFLISLYALVDSLKNRKSYV